jgi:prophage regulatory protein
VIKFTPNQHKRVHRCEKAERFFFDIQHHPHQKIVSMAGPVIRIKDLMAHMGLSHSTIYKRMKEVEDFPKLFSLGGGAVGWFENDIDAWLEASAAKAKSGTPSKKAKPVKRMELPKPRQKSSQQFTSRPENSTFQSPTKRASGALTLGEFIVHPFSNRRDSFIRT